MSLIPAIRDFCSTLCKSRSPWDRLTNKEFDQNLFNARTTFNQWSAKVQSCAKEELDCMKQAAGVTGPRRTLLARQVLGARRRAQTATRVAEAMLGVIETLEQMKMNREAYESMKRTGAADLARIVGQLEASRDVLGNKLIEIESIPTDSALPDAGLATSEAGLADVMREIEAIETMKAEGKSDAEIDSSLAREPEKA